MTHQRTCLDDRPYESVYFLTETTIDHPVEKVWPHALNIGSWMSAHRLEPLSGEASKVGHFERVWPRELADDIPEPRYHLYGIAAIVPYKCIALEVLPENGGSYGSAREWMSFDSILFADLGGRTRLIFHMVDVHMGRGTPDFHERRRKELEDIAGGLLRQYFENLKRLVARE
jgi:hypothetical protein